MEPKYIVAIVALSVFFVLFIIFFILLARRRKMEAKLQAWLYEVYSDKNLIKMDYDSANDDESVQTVQGAVRRAEMNMDANQEESDEVQLKIEEAFNKIEIEGIEEITGNYNPD